MNLRYSLAELNKLPVAERLAAIEKVWEMIAAQGVPRDVDPDRPIHDAGAEIVLSPLERAELRRRFEARIANPREWKSVRRGVDDPEPPLPAPPKP